MSTISIELTPQEASDLRTLLRESIEKLRQANERMSRQDEEFETHKNEAEAVIARLLQDDVHVERHP